METVNEVINAVISPYGMLAAAVFFMAGLAAGFLIKTPKD